MTDAITVIKDTYSYEDAKTIVSHGCQSGVCFKHIYYGDTIEFFNKYPEQITRYLVDNLSIEFLRNTLEDNDGNIDGYINDQVWAFIEQVCFDIIEEYESTTLEELSNDGYNPERSMTESRYAMV